MLASVWFCSAMVWAEQPSMTVIHELKEVAQTGTVGVVVNVIAVHKWGCPAIKSDAHVRRMHDGPGKERGILDRELGLSLAKRIAETADRLAVSADTTALYDETQDLFALAGWLGRKRSYGNLVLIARCHDVAAIGLAKLTVNQEYPLAAVQGLLKAYDPSVYTALCRSQVLNEELGVNIFSVESLSDENAQHRLEDTWGIGRYLQRHQKGDVSPPGAIPSGVDVRLLKEHLDLFKEEGSHNGRGAKTVIDAWDEFEPERFVAGMRPKNIDLVNVLVEFRAKVGGFPRIAVEDSEAGKVAFESAWRQYWDVDSPRHQRTHYSRAWSAYVTVLKGNFLDQDSMLLRLGDKGGGRKQ